MAQPGTPAFVPHLPLQSHPPTQASGTHGFLRKWFGRQNGGSPQYAPEGASEEQEEDPDPTDPEESGQACRMSRKVVPGLPRAQTFRRQQSERRDNLTPIEPSHDERRAASVDHRSHGHRASSTSRPEANPRTSAPGLLGSVPHETPRFVSSLPSSPLEHEPIGSTLHRPGGGDDEATLADECAIQDTFSMTDTQSLTTSQYDAMIHEELEKVWILNLSMHFRDRSKREKFFVTYRERDHVWRRVTISLDYRNAPLNSLEMDLFHTEYQRDKSAKIYEAIRESLPDIQFYDTVTNLKLQTTDGRLHVHVVEDGNEVIHYPTINQVQHLGCRRVPERDITFDSHMSGFVYKVQVNGQTLIKKEIPSPDTIDEFLYEINALSRLRHSRNVIHFYGVVVDDYDEQVKGLLINYADRGALIDIVYEHCKENKSEIPWSTREKWARQIVQGLSDIHEAGFVQGDFTLSNIVIDDNDDAKIIDINRRGCPVGWEPPEATPLIKCNQRISMYIGVKSDLYQLGMVLWAIAMQDDDPENQGRPLVLGPEIRIPDWYRRMTETCLSDDPRMRLQASSLMDMFPRQVQLDEGSDTNSHPPLSVDDPYQQYLVDDYDTDDQPQIRTVEPPSEWSYVSRPYADASPLGYEPYYYTRGRSPPSPIPSQYGGYHSPGGIYGIAAWAANRDIPSSYSDVVDDGDGRESPTDETPTGENTSLVRPLTETTLDSTLESVKAKQEESSLVLEAADALAAGVSAVRLGMTEPSAESAAVVGDIEQGVLGIAVGEGIESSESSFLSPSANPTANQVPEGGQVFCPDAVPTNKGPADATTSKGNLNESRTGVEQTPKCIVKDQDRGLSTSPVEKVLGPELLGDQTDAGRDVQEPKQAKAEQELSAQQLPGHTVPDARAEAAATETSSKTATPLSTCGPVDPTQEKSATHCEGSSSNETGNEVKAEGAKVPESLNGIGAAHLMNNEDMMRQKQTIDEDFNEMADSAQLSLPPPR